MSLLVIRPLPRVKMFSPVCEKEKLDAKSLTGTDYVTCILPVTEKVRNIELWSVQGLKVNRMTSL